MKKRRLKKWVKETLAIMCLVLITLIVGMALCQRAEQINESEKIYEKVNY